MAIGSLAQTRFTKAHHASVKTRPASTICMASATVVLSLDAARLKFGLDAALQELAAQHVEFERVVGRATFSARVLRTKRHFLAQVTNPQVFVNASYALRGAAQDARITIRAGRRLLIGTG